MGVHANAAASAVLPLLDDASSDVRYKTAWALGTMGNDLAVEPLIGCLQRKDASLRSAAAAALSQLTGEEFGDDHARWKEWLDRNK